MQQAEGIEGGFMADKWIFSSLRHNAGFSDSMSRRNRGRAYGEVVCILFAAL